MTHSLEKKDAGDCAMSQLSGLAERKDFIATLCKDNKGRYPLYMLLKNEKIAYLSREIETVVKNQMEILD